MIVETKGKMDYCPFRIIEKTHISMLVGEGSSKIQHFMPCMKDACICYKRTEDNGFVRENCYRDQIGYERTHKESEGYE